MCTSKELVRNKYTGKEFYCSCGKCPSCLQEKADKRTIRIINTCPSGYVPLFFHLTYSPDSLPYIDISELQFIKPSKLGESPIFNHVSVYRDSYKRLFYDVQHNNYRILKYDGSFYLTDYFYDSYNQYDLSKFHIIDGCKVGVLYYPDVQLFFKRLRITLKRNEKYSILGCNTRKLYYFVTGEFGETFSRPHWHIILFVPKFENSLLSKWREVISQSWLLADYKLTYDNVDFAIAAASYASSYVNCSSEISPFFQNADFRPCWHYSYDFGFDHDSFSLSSLLDSIKKRDLRYTSVVIPKNGKSRVVTSTIPSYVTNRWFPPFKGFCNLSYEEIIDALSVPSNVIKYKKKLGLSDIEISDYINMVHRFAYRFKLATTQPSFGESFWYKVYPHEVQFNIRTDEPFYNKHCFLLHYALWYVDFLRAKNTTKFILLYTDFRDDYDYVQRYDNIEDVRLKLPLTYRFFKNSFKYIDVDKYVCSCNEFNENVALTLRRTERFYKKIKQRKITQNINS